MKTTYTPEQKLSIINRYITGRESYLKRSANTGISKNTFYTWIKQYKIEKRKQRKNRSITAILYYLRIRLNDWKI